MSLNWQDLLLRLVTITLGLVFVYREFSIKHDVRPFWLRALGAFICLVMIVFVIVSIFLK